MADRNNTDPPSEKDRLMARPDPAPLPTPLDPQAPQSRGYPADPKPVPLEGQGDPDAKDPAPTDVDRAV